jgi:hypothetical protein
LTKKDSISIEKIEKEIEVYKTDKLDDRKIYQSFGIEEEIIENLSPKPIKMSPQTKLSMTMIFILIIYSIFSSSIVYSHSKSSLIQNSMFNITSDMFLTHIEIKAKSYRLIKNLEIDIKNTKLKDITLKYRDDNITFKNKMLSGMTKGYKNQVDIYIKLPKGKYNIKSQNNKNISIKIEQNYVRMIYISVIIALYILYMIIFFISLSYGLNFLYYTIVFIIGSLTIGFIPSAILLIIFKVYMSKKAKK